MGRRVGLLVRRLLLQRLVRGVRTPQRRLRWTNCRRSMLRLWWGQCEQRMDFHHRNTLYGEHAKLGSCHMVKSVFVAIVFFVATRDAHAPAVPVMLRGTAFQRCGCAHAAACCCINAHFELRLLFQTVRVPLDLYSLNPSAATTQSTDANANASGVAPTHANLTCLDFKSGLCYWRAMSSIEGTGGLAASDACCECGATYVVRCAVVVVQLKAVVKQRSSGAGRLCIAGRTD